MEKYDVIVYEDVGQAREIRGRASCIADTAEEAERMTLQTYSSIRYPLLCAHAMILPYANRVVTDIVRVCSNEL